MSDESDIQSPSRRLSSVRKAPPIHLLQRALTRRGEVFDKMSKAEPRWFSQDEVLKQPPDAFWAVVDGFVVDVKAFSNEHPGGLPKITSTNDAKTGATGRPFGFSFSKGENQHFPATQKLWRDGYTAYLKQGADGELPPHDVVIAPPKGTITILGKLK